jgi:glycerol-3-phosphate acyltransferase PlsY
VDVRQSGSHHATATNTIRQAGFAAGAFVLILDITKGFLPVYLANRFGSGDWVAPIAAGLVVIGHCWPVFAGFRGGMGLAATGGAVLAVSPFGFLIALGLLIFLVLVIRHSARASFITGLLMPALFWLIGMRGIPIWVSLAAGLVVAIRFLEDWNRQYRELWLDRG